MNYESGKAAQDAPPAPRKQANLRCGHCLHAWNGSSRERSCPGCGREFVFFGPEIGTFPPAHEALIARLADYAEHTQRCEKWERDWHGNGIALLDERSCTCGLSDILTALKEKQ